MQARLEAEVAHLRGELDTAEVWVLKMFISFKIIVFNTAGDA